MITPMVCSSSSCSDICAAQSPFLCVLFYFVRLFVIFYGKIPVRISEAANRRTDTTMTERKNDKKANKIKQNTQKWRLSSTNFTTRRV
jgi:hypothetical protein